MKIALICIPLILWGAGGGLSIWITEVSLEFDRSGTEAVGSDLNVTSSTTAITELVNKTWYKFSPLCSQVALSETRRVIGW